MKYAVVICHNFDADTKVTLFDNHDKAKAYLHWVWEKYYNEEIRNNALLNEADCWHEDDLAKISWADKCYTYFELINPYETPEEDFECIDWKRYL